MANEKIKFGTDGWRAIIGLDYTVDNVRRVAEATAHYMKSEKMKRAIIGHDCRFGGRMFAEMTARVLGAHGIRCQIGTGFVSTPMVSLGVVKTKSDLGIVITASHNPPSYNGYKLKSAFGGPTIPSEVAKVESHIPPAVLDGPLPSLASLVEKGIVKDIDLETMYLKHARAGFDLAAIKKAGFKIGYDAMYGAGQRAVKKLLPKVVALHIDENPGMHGQAPEPIARNLTQLAALIRKDPKITVGLANDGDADRIGMFDEDGNFVDSHHLLLLLLLYLHKYKGLSGKVVYTFSVTDKMKKMADAFGLPSVCTAIGFKYIAEIMVTEDVLVGGEESGGLAVKGHIPERDGVWIGLMVFEFMAKTGKTIKQLIEEVYAIVGRFAVDRDDLHVTEEAKQRIIAACRAGEYKAFGPLKIAKVEDIDGWKFKFNDDEWVMLRASGTEPVLRVYAQSGDLARCREILEATKKAIL